MTTLDLTFEDVVKFVKDDSPELFEDAERLLGLIVLFSPLYAPAALTAGTTTLGLVADLLTVKAAVFGLGKTILDKITSRRDNDSLQRLHRMQAAYCLICYTAFFEALQKALPKVVKPLKLTANEKLALSESALRRLTEQSGDSKPALESLPELDLSHFQIHLPHPIYSFDAQKRHLLPLYRELTKGFTSFLECLVVWESASEDDRKRTKKILGELPDKSWAYFQAQYVRLASTYQEFYIWANLHEHTETRKLLQRMPKYVQQYSALAEASGNQVDLGFRRLAEIIALIPARIDESRANSTLRELATLYENTIEEPVIKDSSDGNTEPGMLRYPKKSDIFIPQAFKAIRYSGKEKLESEGTWKSVKIRNDLGTFLLNYLSSPYSAETPLVILGHPGSGKSLLTSVLAARLVTPSITPIRVELRNINADNEIPVQIEEQVNKNTGRNANWASLSDHFGDRPPVVLLDGYDELLQASGRVFSGYLLKVQKFQENERHLGRKPVRAIVTSRITLIDKAEIPRGSTIVRLLEFDVERRKRWIDVWNLTNQQYFKETGIRPFELPDDGKIIALAEQPLLLLMLALYDSEKNQLRDSKGLEQTALYDSLLRQFVERERRKDVEFQALKERDRTAEIEKDLERLGIAAIGMFNRRSLHIKISELNRDLSFFRADKQVQISSGRLLTQAELLLGSFFFIHESTSVHKNGSPQERGVDAAFEFLHNTFGEFLAADFILRNVLAETQSLYKLRNDDDLRSDLEQKLVSPNGLGKKWFACLMYTPLFSRPVILDMMREWLKYGLKRRNRSEMDFLEDLDTIVSSQIKLLLTSNTLPSIMTEGDSTFDPLPITGYLAIYSLNIILLRTMLAPEGYTFSGAALLPSYEDGTRAWDRLAFLWRSWFSLESLNGLTAIVTVNRDGVATHLRAKEIFSTSSSNNRLELVLNVSLALADDVMAGLSGFLSHDSISERGIALNDIEVRLHAEQIDLRLELITRRLQQFRMIGPIHGSAESLVLDGLRLFERLPHVNQEIASLFIEESIKVAENTEPEIAGRLLRFLIDFYHPRIAWIPLGKIIRLGRDMGENRYLEYFLERVLLRGFRWEQLTDLKVEDAVELIKLAQELGGPRFRESMIRSIVGEAIHEVLRPRSRPELALEVFRLAREFEDREELTFHFQRYLREYVEGQGRRTLPPPQTLAVIELARELEDREFLEFYYRRHLREYFREEWQGLNLVLVAEIIKLSREFDDKALIRRWARRYVHEYVVQGRTTGLDPMIVVEFIRIAREFGDVDLLEPFYKEYIRRARHVIKSFPLDSAKDLYWLARFFDDEALLRDLQTWTA